MPGTEWCLISIFWNIELKNQSYNLDHVQNQSCKNWKSSYSFWVSVFLKPKDWIPLRNLYTYILWLYGDFFFSLLSDFSSHTPPQKKIILLESVVTTVCLSLWLCPHKTKITKWFHHICCLIWQKVYFQVMEA